MTPEQKQEIERLAGDNSQLSDYSRDALRALLEDCGRAEGLVEYWHDERDKLYQVLDATLAVMAQARSQLATAEIATRKSLNAI